MDEQVVVVGARDDQQPLVAGAAPAVEQTALGGRDQAVALAVDDQGRAGDAGDLGGVPKAAGLFGGSGDAAAEAEARQQGKGVGEAALDDQRRDLRRARGGDLQRRARCPANGP